MKPFTLEQKYAIVTVLTMIMAADSVIHPKESEYLDKVLLNLGITPLDVDQIESFDDGVCLKVFKSLDDEQRSYAQSMFCEMAMSDGRLDPREQFIIDMFEQ